MKVTLHDGLLYGFLGVYILYGFTVLGMTGLLFSFAVGLIVLSFHVRVELSVAAVVLAGVAWKLWKSRKHEGFQAPTGYKADDVISTLQTLKKNSEGPTGVLSSSFTEGFADADTDTKPTPTPTALDTKKEDKPAATAAVSTPASVTAPPAEPVKTAGFSDKAAEGMFKLGSIPADTVGGAHIDIGTTMMNALNALKPDQVKQMTDDTRSLMETQKSLMGMLSTMKPMLNDGKQLMNTFNDMFGKGGPTGGGAADAAPV